MTLSPLTLDLYRRIEEVLRTAVREALLDAEFGSIFADDKRIQAEGRCQQEQRSQYRELRLRVWGKRRAGHPANAVDSRLCK